MKLKLHPRESARKQRKKIELFWRAAGPGIITGAADDDPSGIGTYSQAGAQFGFLFLWAAVVTWPLMAFVQMACAQVGMVTGEGLATAFAKKVPRSLLILVCVALFLANTLNVAADLLAMSDAAKMLGAGPTALWVVLFGVGISVATIHLHYRTIARVLQWLALVLFSYVATAFVVKIDWPKALHATFVPSLPHTAQEWSMIVAILGTTISPYLFFWQTAQEVEEKNSRNSGDCTELDLFIRRVDVGVGTLFSNVVMFFIILATATTLHEHGLTNIETSQQAAEALRPIAGSLAYLLYTLGLIGTGLLAIPTLTGSAAYAFAETFGWREGLDLDWRKAKPFYAVIVVSTLIAIAADFAHVNPIKALYGSAIVNGVLAPFVLAILWFVVRDPVLMRARPASFTMQLVLAICTLFMFASLVPLFFF